MSVTTCRQLLEWMRLNRLELIRHRRRITYDLPPVNAMPAPKDQFGTINKYAELKSENVIGYNCCSTFCVGFKIAHLHLWLDAIQTVRNSSNFSNYLQLPITSKQSLLLISCQFSKCSNFSS